MLEDIEASMKIIVVGNGVVGKTSMTQRFAKNIFTNEYKKTLGVDFLMKKKYIKPIDKEVEFMIWDTAGQEYYDAITRRYYKGASGALIVFSVTDKDSFDSVKKWYDKVRAECEEIPMVLVMNKVDLVNDAVITEKQALDLAKTLKLKLFKTSVKDNMMINEVFETLAIDFFSKGKNGIENQYDIILFKIFIHFPFCIIRLAFEKQCARRY
jgi:Ras-related protein Rab-23